MLFGGLKSSTEVVCQLLEEAIQAVTSKARAEIAVNSVSV